MPAKKLTADDYRKRKIKSAMAAKGLTGEQCAKRMKMCGSAYSRMISRLSCCRVRDLEVLCMMLDIDIKDVLEVSV